MKFFTDFLKAWTFSHEAENHGSKLQFWAKIGKYVVILPALIWLVLSLASCSVTVTAMQMQLPGGESSSRINCLEHVSRRNLKGAKITDSTITTEIDGATLTMWYK